MSIMYGQVCGRKRNGEQILPAEPTNFKPKPVKRRRRATNAKKLTTGLKTNTKASSVDWKRKEYNKVKADKAEAKKKLAKIETNRRNEIATTTTSNHVLMSAKCEPEIGTYHRRWANHYVYVEVCEGNKRLFSTVGEAVDYINEYEGSDELTESWLSFLIATRLPKYRIYNVGLVKMDGTTRALKERDKDNGR